MDRPWISCNLAISADGKISSAGHRPANWTSPRDHERLKQLRRPAQALMVGRGTAETDQMTLRVDGDGPQPLRCVVSRYGQLPADHPLFHSLGGAIHLVATEGYRGPGEHRARATIHECPLADFLHLLHRQHGVAHLHCEGGGQLIRALAELDAIDEFHLTLAGHTLLGGKLSPTATGTATTYLPASREYELSHVEPLTETGECFLTYRRKDAQ